jgi:hypothetical protein
VRYASQDRPTEPQGPWAGLYAIDLSPISIDLTKRNVCWAERTVVGVGLGPRTERRQAWPGTTRYQRRGSAAATEEYRTPSAQLMTLRFTNRLSAAGEAVWSQVDQTEPSTGASPGPGEITEQRACHACAAHSPAFVGGNWILTTARQGRLVTFRLPLTALSCRLRIHAAADPDVPAADEVAASARAPVLPRARTPASYRCEASVALPPTAGQTILRPEPPSARRQIDLFCPAFAIRLCDGRGGRRAAGVRQGTRRAGRSDGDVAEPDSSAGGSYAGPS